MRVNGTLTFSTATCTHVCVILFYIYLRILYLLQLMYKVILGHYMLVIIVSTHQLLQPILSQLNLLDFIIIQSDSGGICSTLGNDSMCDSKQKSSYEHGSDFERLPRYGKKKTRTILRARTAIT